MTDLTKLTIASLHEGLTKKAFSAAEVVRAVLARIKEMDKKLGAFLSVNEGGALRDAEAVDRAIAKGEHVRALAGVPLAIKDAILAKGLPATAGSKILERYTASYDAFVIQKLKKAHAIVIGKTNLDEFAMGASTENSAFQLTRNPYDLTRVPGGSSGGSAVAVATGMALAALGSDTGGSIRQPASFCGVVGLKPTYGAVSRSGLIALASSHDHIGPITKTVEDAAILFQTIAGRDAFDATSADYHYENDNDLLRPNFGNIKNLKIGIPKEYFIPGMDAGVAAAVEEAIGTFKAQGFTIKEVSLPHTKYAVACYYIILPAEASANLARYEGIRYSRIQGSETSTLQKLYEEQRGHGLGPEPKRRIILGTFVLSSGYYDAYYAKAQSVRTLIKRDFNEAFRDVDVLLTPTAPTPAFKIGEKAQDPLRMYLCDIFTAPADLAGVPAISIPIKTNEPYDPSHLPVGFQLIGRHFREADIVGLGQYYENAVK